MVDKIVVVMGIGRASQKRDFGVLCSLLITVTEGSFRFPVLISIWQRGCSFCFQFQDWPFLWFYNMCGTLHSVFCRGPTLQIITKTVLELSGRACSLGTQSTRSPGSLWLLMGTVEGGDFASWVVWGLSISLMSFLTWALLMKTRPYGEVRSVNALAMWSFL